MFTLSSKAVYGTTAVLDLAEHYGSGPIQIRDLAERGSIPQHYLEQIMSALKRSGIVRSYRGARGGYELAVSPETLQLGSVLSELEGALEVAPSNTGDPARYVWDAIEGSLSGILTTSLTELLRIQRAARSDADFII